MPAAVVAAVPAPPGAALVRALSGTSGRLTFYRQAAGPWYGADLFFLPSSSTLSTHSAYSVNDLPAITASATALRSALRRLVHLQCVSVVGFVDVEDSDDLPVTSAHSSAIIDAMTDSRIKRLELKDGHFARTYGYGGVLNERRIRAMRELESVHVAGAVRWGAAQLQVLLSCPQLVDVRLSGDICLSPPQLQAMSAAWPAVRSVRVDPMVVDDAKQSACHQVDEAEALLTRCCLRPTLDATQPHTTTSVCVSEFLPPLLSFSHLTSLHLSFAGASLVTPYSLSPSTSPARSFDLSVALCVVVLVVVQLPSSTAADVVLCRLGGMGAPVAALFPSGGSAAPPDHSSDVWCAYVCCVGLFAFEQPAFRGPAVG